MIRRALFVLVVIASFYPYLLSIVGSTRLLIAALLVLTLAFSFGSHGPVHAPGGSGFLLGLTTATVGFGAVILLSPHDVIGQSNLQRFVIVFPLALITGIAWAEPDERRFVERAISAVGIGTSILAITEYVAGRSLFGRTAEFAWLVRDGSSRALLGSEHALVLGVMLAATLPFILSSMRGVLRLASVAIVFAGVWATDSRGALLIAVALTAIQAIPPLTRMAKRRKLALSTLIIAAVTLGYLAINVWQPATYSRDWSQNSLEYRPALYSLLPDILQSAPFGYGPGTLPQNVWYIVAPDRALDVTRSVDSQIVLSALRWGWPGVLVFLAGLAISLLAIRRNHAVGFASLTVTLSGAFLALDAWDGLGMMWSLLLGMAIAVTARPPEHAEGNSRASHELDQTDIRPLTDMHRSWSRS